MTAPACHHLPWRARRHLAAGRSQLTYNPYSTATWRIASQSGTARYLKAAFVGAYPSLAAEIARAVWLRECGVSVPEVIDHGAADGVEWMLTAALPGVAATAPEHLARPEVTVPLLADGLRRFHAIDLTACPFDYRMAVALDHVARRVAAEEVSADDFHDVHRGLDPSAAIARLDELNIDESELVVCHGDFTPPNVLLDAGRVAGYLDLGEVGVSDRWRDLAIATWSVTWNFGPGYEDLFLESYGVEWDVHRRDLYRLLYDLES
jgi:kanamycin kinase